jgi:hypothetical protein
MSIYGLELRSNKLNILWKQNWQLNFLSIHTVHHVFLMINFMPIEVVYSVLYYDEIVKLMKTCCI